MYRNLISEMFLTKLYIKLYQLQLKNLFADNVKTIAMIQIV